MIKTLTKTKTLLKSKSRPVAPSSDDRPVVVISTVVIAKRNYHICSQPVVPVQFGTQIMPEGFMTETGLLPSDE